MRQLFIVHGPAFGGGQAQFVRLREPLARRDWTVTGLVPAGAPAAERLRADGVRTLELELHRLRASPDPRVQLPFLASIAPEVRALRRVIREEAVDLVQVHGDTNPHGAIAAHLEGRAVVWQLYDTVTPAPLRRVTMPLVLRLADVITTWGRALGEEHPGTETLGERWLTVFPPVDENEFRPPSAERRAAARAELDVPDGALVVGAVGNRNPTKGHEHLARALAKLRRAHPEVVGRVLGAPSPAHADYEASVRREAAELGLGPDALDIRDAGRRVPQIVPAFDVFALASVRRSEGMPTVILEAMACGIPVVATDVGAVRELVVDGETALVVEPEDPTALAAALARLAADPQLRERLGENGRRRFQERFGLEALADLHAQAYALALEHRRRRR